MFRIYVTNWGRVYIRKLAVIHLVNNFPFLWTLKIYYSVRRQSAIGSHLSQSNPVHNLLHYLSKIHFNIILLFTLMRYNSSFLCMLPRLTLRRLMSYIYIYIYIYMEHPFLMFLDHTQRRNTVGRTPLDE